MTSLIITNIWAVVAEEVAFEGDETSISGMLGSVAIASSYGRGLREVEIGPPSLRDSLSPVR